MPYVQIINSAGDPKLLNTQTDTLSNSGITKTVPQEFDMNFKGNNVFEASHSQTKRLFAKGLHLGIKSFVMM